MNLNVETPVHYFPVGLESSIQFTIPYLDSEYQCNTTTPLPDGMYITANNEIVGRVLQAQPLSEYSLYCHNDYSETNHVKISIAVTDKFNKGTVGYYMKSSPFDDNCYGFLKPTYDGVTSEFIRIDKSVTHEYDENNTIWDGLTPNFVNKYGIRWEGYLQFEKDVTDIKLSSVDSSFLFLGSMDYSYLEHTCSDDYGFETRSVSLAKGLYSFALNYRKGTTSRGNGIKLEIKMDGDDDYVDASDYLVYVPNGDFEYTYHTVTYSTDKDIQSNIPIFSNNDKVVKGYTIIPSLPDGLELNPTTGTITGNPSTTQTKKEYTVTVEFDDNTKLSTLIYIKIDGDSTPTGLHIIDYNTGEELKSPIIVYLGENYDFLAAPLNGYVDDIKFTKYPEQLSGNKQRLMTDVPLSNTFENEEIIIEATLLNGDKMTQSYNITCKSKCEEGKTLHVVNRYSYTSGSFSLSTEDGENVFEYDLSSNENYYVTIGCLVPDNYIFTMKVEGIFYGVTFNVMTDGKDVSIVTLEAGQSEGTFHISTSIYIYLFNIFLILIYSWNKTYCNIS